MFQDWGNITVGALQNAWAASIHFIPELIAAIIVFIIGWIVSVVIGKIIAEILKRLKFDQLFKKGSWDEALQKANIKVDPSGFIGAIVKWILVIVTLQISVGILGWKAFNDILLAVVGYLPNVVVAVVFFVATVIIADIVEKVVRVSVERAKVGYGHMTSVIVKWAIWIFAIILILEQLNIGGEIPTIIVWGIVGAFSLAAGLAFGLGGRETAARMLDDLHQKMKK